MALTDSWRPCIEWPGIAGPLPPGPGGVHACKVEGQAGVGEVLPREPGVEGDCQRPAVSTAITEGFSLDPACPGAGRLATIAPRL